jgi:ribonuclease R
MDVEREVVDLYRALMMRDRIGDTCEGTVTGLAGSGAYVTLDAPFVDVLVRYESMGPDHYEISEDELSVVGARSGDTLSLGDRISVIIEDVAVLRRSVYAKRIVPKKVLEALENSPRALQRGRKPTLPAARNRNLAGGLKVAHRPTPTRKAKAGPRGQKLDQRRSTRGKKRR